MEDTYTNEQQCAMLYRQGWNINGEWKCPLCNTMIGKNLLGDKPFLLARQHIERCNNNENRNK